LIDPEKELKEPASSGREATVVDRTTRLVPVMPRRQAQAIPLRRQARF
jgi:hypothetical protein